MQRGTGGRENPSEAVDSEIQARGGIRVDPKCI